MTRINTWHFFDLHDLQGQVLGCLVATGLALNMDDKELFYLWFFSVEEISSVALLLSLIDQREVARHGKLNGAWRVLSVRLTQLLGLTIRKNVFQEEAVEQQKWCGTALQDPGLAQGSGPGVWPRGTVVMPRACVVHFGVKSAV